LNYPRLPALADIVEAALRSEVPDLGHVHYGRPWAELGLDSFGLLALRASLEHAIGHEIDDSDWVEAATPEDAIRLLADAGSGRARPGPSELVLREEVELGLPQMALCGLSESWLLKILGDLHWRLIAEALDVKPADIRDASGNRLYPTFTRIRFVSSRPLAAYLEGERLAFSASLSRLGAALFFSNVGVQGEDGRSVSAELMSSFSHRGAEPGNSDLLRGQPQISAACRATALAEMPDFGLFYQEMRRTSAVPRPILARAGYEILPQYDINGVGLLYCAAYPMIADISQMRARGAGAGWAAETSTIERDTCFFANADIGSRPEWRLHEDEHGDGLSTVASIVRDDGVVMAWVRTRKVAL
jgi:probable biosynthetic protein (TIGR04098 family)